VVLGQAPHQEQRCGRQPVRGVGGEGGQAIPGHVSVLLCAEFVLQAAQRFERLVRGLPNMPAPDSIA